MPCNKCNADFNLLNWKTKCNECETYFCAKCLKKVDGDAFCEVCEVLSKRPPIKTKLMELKVKDLQQYLNRRNVSTRGVVEKQELVDLFYGSSIPVKSKRRHKYFTVNSLSGSIPNLAQRSQTYLNTLRNQAGFTFNQNWSTSTNVTPRRSPENQTETFVFDIPPQTFYPNQPTPSAPPAPNDEQLPTTSRTNAAFDPQPEHPSPQVPRKVPKLSDFGSIDDLNDLSVKELKELLALNRVDYKGCVERGELLDRAERLWLDLNTNKQGAEEGLIEDANNLCKVCMDAPLECVLLECGHMATCVECGKQMAECPICRQYVTRVVRTFRA